MIYDLSTNLVPLFSGTYETQWSDINDYLDTGEVPLEYDFNELMRSIAGAYQDNQDYILSELGIPWVKSIKFTGGTWSPREYNFSTDSLDFRANIDMKAMYKYLEGLEHSTEFTQWLRDNYSSRDGFISFTPDTWLELSQEIRGHHRNETQAIGALMRWAGLQSNPENFDYMGNIEGHIYEEWNGNGWGGLETWVECGECYKRMQYDTNDGAYHCTNEECKVNTSK